MRISFTQLVIELSNALDYVEKELVGVQTNHSKRVAYICALLGKQEGLEDWEVADLAACAVLHDNALSEYLQIEYLSTGQFPEKVGASKLGLHCTIGERNVQGFPFRGNRNNVILYHHENADGTGPFSKKEHEVSFFSSLIHLADQVDARFGLKDMSEVKWDKINRYLEENRGKLFGDREVKLFQRTFTREILENLRDETLDEALRQVLVYVEEDYSPEQIMRISGIFARIVDYKSTFTSMHSMGIAHKAYTMAAFYELDEEMRAKLFLAGALHDIGKLAVDVDILEKPDKLTDEEFEQIQNHAVVTYRILSRIRGMEDICEWASYHHEKLNGKGYPFGYDGSRLSKLDRLMGCLDIYQALREDRPYKKGLAHEKTMDIMKTMVEGGFIDGEITEDIDQVFGDDTTSQSA